MQSNQNAQVEAPRRTKIGVTGDREQRLAGNMRTFDVAFSVLAFNAPLSGVVGFVPAVIGFGNGLGAPVAYLGVGVLLICFAVGFTTMSRHLPNPGAFYAYITAGLGREIGLGSSFVAIFSYVFVMVGAYAFGGIAIQSLVHDTFGGPDLPWWLFVLILISGVGILGYFRIDLSAKVLTLVMCLEVLIVAAWDARVLFGDGPQEHFVNVFAPEAAFSGSLGLALLFCFSSFSGFEATAIFREEVKNPEKTIPRATYLAVGFLTMFYALAAYTLIVSAGQEKAVETTSADPTGAALGSMQLYLGTVAGHVITVLLCTSIFASCLSIHNVNARYVYSLSVDGIFPKTFSNVHRKHASPHRASVLTTVVAVVFTVALMLSQVPAATLYATMIGIGGYALILLLFLTSVAVIPYLLFRRSTAIPLSTIKMVISPALAAIGLGYALYLGTTNITALTGQSEEVSNTVLLFPYVLLTMGVLVALILRKRRPAVYQRIGRQDP